MALILFRTFSFLGYEEEIMALRIGARQAHLDQKWALISKASIHSSCENFFKQRKETIDIMSKLT